MHAFGIIPGRDFLVYREKTKQWEGPYKLASYDGYKTAKVDMGNEIKSFSITAVKPSLNEDSEVILSYETDMTTGPRIEVFWPLDDKYYPRNIVEFNKHCKKCTVKYNDEDIEKLNLSKEKWGPLAQSVVLFNALSAMSMIAKVSRIYPSIYVTIVEDPLDSRFIWPSTSEIKGLFERKSWELVKKSAIPEGATILKSRVQH